MSLHLLFLLPLCVIIYSLFIIQVTRDLIRCTEEDSTDSFVNSITSSNTMVAAKSEEQRVYSKEDRQEVEKNEDQYLTNAILFIETWTSIKTSNSIDLLSELKKTTPKSLLFDLVFNYPNTIFVVNDEGYSLAYSLALLTVLALNIPTSAVEQVIILTREFRLLMTTMTTELPQMIV